MPICKGIYLNKFSSQPDFAQGQLHLRSLVWTAICHISTKTFLEGFSIPFGPLKGHCSISAYSSIVVSNDFSKSKNMAESSSWNQVLKTETYQMTKSSKSTRLCAKMDVFGLFENNLSVFNEITQIPDVVAVDAVCLGKAKSNVGKKFWKQNTLRNYWVQIL